MVQMTHVATLRVESAHLVVRNALAVEVDIVDFKQQLRWHDDLVDSLFAAADSQADAIIRDHSGHPTNVGRRHNSERMRNGHAATKSLSRWPDPGTLASSGTGSTAIGAAADPCEHLFLFDSTGQNAHANLLGGLLDFLHGLSHTGAGSLVAAVSLGDVVSSVLHKFYKAIVRFHDVSLLKMECSSGF
jgi:hypothetical protein